MAYQDTHNFTSDKLSGFERTRVDVASTGFFEGREFRTFKELNIAASATYVIKIFVPINVILLSVDVAIESGHLRLGTYVGGTSGGSFSETLPIFNANNMSLGVERRRNRAGLGYTKQTILTAGGTHTGGTELDVLRLKSATATAQTQSVGAAAQDERGVAALEYYWRFQNLDTNTAILGTFRARWEERPVGFFTA